LRCSRPPAKGGFRGGAAATLGVILGDQVLLWLAVAGVAALLAANPLCVPGVCNTPVPPTWPGSA
jgi:threonine/homoserine/homoserine lactone efflux protein